jgi:hypothetical protein
VLEVEQDGEEESTEEVTALIDTGEGEDEQAQKEAVVLEVNVWGEERERWGEVRTEREERGLVSEGVSGYARTIHHEQARVTERQHQLRTTRSKVSKDRPLTYRWQRQHGSE